MSDFSDNMDRANEEAERHLQRALINSRRPAGPAITGLCAWCGEPVGPQRRFCLPEVDDCMERWERRSGRK